MWRVRFALPFVRLAVVCFGLLQLSVCCGVVRFAVLFSLCYGVCRCVVFFGSLWCFRVCYSVVRCAVVFSVCCAYARFAVLFFGLLYCFSQ